MLIVRNRFAGGSQNSQPNPARRPLRLKNTNVLNSTVAKLKSVIKRDEAPKRVFEEKVKGSEEMGEREWNKENIPVMIEGLESSLGAELIEMRKRAERLKLDKEETEKRLKERDLVFEVWMENTNKRSEEGRKLEKEMDRIFSVSELRVLTSISPVKSLREKEGPLSVLSKRSEDDMVESVGENSAGSSGRRRAWYVGDFGDDLELGLVSAESRC